MTTHLQQNEKTYKRQKMNFRKNCEHRYAFRDCADAAEERYLRETLAMLQESYAKAAKPYMDRLVLLHSRSLPQMLVTVEQAQALGLMPANGEVRGASVTAQPACEASASTVVLAGMPGRKERT